MNIVKKIFLFILFFLLLGCGSQPLYKNNTTKIICPKVLFSSEHKNYIDSESDEISLDNITLKSEVNNAEFVKGCKINNNLFSSNLSILFIVNPLNNTEEEFVLPFYIALVDKNNELLEIYYYSIDGYFKTDIESKEFIETEIRETVKINFDYNKEVFSVLIGFMLDEKKNKLLN